METVDIDCSLSYKVNQESEFIIHIQAAFHPWQQIISESLDIIGGKPEYFLDPSGINRFFRFSSLNNQCDIRYQATVEINMPPRDENAQELEIAQLPAHLLHYLLPSRYCESDLISPMAQRQFGQLPQGFSRVEAICDWIKNNVEYVVGASGSNTTACDILHSRAGVCRDFAHLGIALCRSLNIPARFVFGHVEFPDPPADFHALFEAYLGGQWILFDPTRMAPLEKIVRIGTGIDAQDVVFACMYGDVQMLALNPLVRDHVVGQPLIFQHAHDFIGSKDSIRM